MARPTVACRSCGEHRVPKHMLLVECNLPQHQGGHRDCLAPMYICRPSLSGKPFNHRPDCLSRSVIGADIHRLVVPA